MGSNNNINDKVFDFSGLICCSYLVMFELMQTSLIQNTASKIILLADVERYEIGLVQHKLPTIVMKFCFLYMRST